MKRAWRKPGRWLDDKAERFQYGFDKLPVWMRSIVCTLCCMGLFVGLCIMWCIIMLVYNEYIRGLAILGAVILTLLALTGVIRVPRVVWLILGCIAVLNVIAPLPVWVWVLGVAGLALSWIGQRHEKKQL